MALKIEITWNKFLKEKDKCEYECEECPIFVGLESKANQKHSSFTKKDKYSICFTIDKKKIILIQQPKSSKNKCTLNIFVMGEELEDLKDVLEIPKKMFGEKFQYQISVNKNFNLEKAEEDLKNVLANFISNPQ